jgi:hypothetical protein
VVRGAIRIGNDVSPLWEWLPATIIAARCRFHRKTYNFIGCPTPPMAGPRLKIDFAVFAQFVVKSDF